MSKYEEALENIAFISIIGEDGKFEDLVKDHKSYKEDYATLQEGISKIEKYDELQTECEGYKTVIEGLKKSLDMKVNEINTLVDGIKAIGVRRGMDDDLTDNLKGTPCINIYECVNVLWYEPNFQTIERLLDIVEGKK